jgi:hypothetical protein
MRRKTKTIVETRFIASHVPPPPPTSRLWWASLTSPRSFGAFGGGGQSIKSERAFCPRLSINPFSLSSRRSACGCLFKEIYEGGVRKVWKVRIVVQKRKQKHQRMQKKQRNERRKRQSIKSEQVSDLRMWWRGTRRDYIKTGVCLLSSFLSPRVV